MKKNCKWCGQEFDSWHNRSYCTEECWTNANRERNRLTAEARRPPAEPKPCGVCGKLFQPRGTQKYCSQECRVKVNRQQQKEFYHRRRAEAPERRVCEWCGEEFTPASGRQIFCSPDCKKAKAREDNVARSTRPLPPRECPVCHIMYTPRTDAQVCCSGYCRKHYNAEIHKSTFSSSSAPAEPRIPQLEEKAKRAKEMGVSYGRLVAMDAVDRYARVELPEWAKGEQNEKI